MTWFLFLLTALCLAGPAEDGLAAWDDGSLDGAIEAWQPALEQGRASAALHYNLGTAYYRRGDLPRAIAHWRAAQIVEPRNTWVLHNLAVARGELEGVGEPASSAPPWLLVAPVGEWGLLGVLLLLLGGLGSWVAQVRRRSGWGAVGVGVVGAALGLAGVVGARQLDASPGAVIVDGEAALRVMAQVDAEVLGTLSPGTEVAVMGQSGEYLLVQDVDGERGWILGTGALVVGSELR